VNRNRTGTLSGIILDIHITKYGIRSSINLMAGIIGIVSPSVLWGVWTPCWCHKHLSQLEFPLEVFVSVLESGLGCI